MSDKNPREADMRQLAEWLGDGALSRGPWRVSSVAGQDSDGEYCGRDHYLVDADGEELAMMSSEADAQVCALARNHAAWLMDEHKRLFREVKIAEGVLSDLQQDSVAAARAIAAESRVKELEEALRPFARWATHLDTFHDRGGLRRPSDLRAIVIGHYDEPVTGGLPGTVGDLRRAARAMEGSP